MNRLLLDADAAEPAETRASTEVLRLTGARVALDARTAVTADVVIGDGRVREVIPQPARKTVFASKAESTVDLAGYMVLPGLINAHDHLEFNLFPRLGNGPYANFREWADDIFRPDAPPVREHLAVPKTVRLWWGAIKNLLCGVTTVCHHNPYDHEVFGDDFPIRVVRRYGWAHSLALEKNVAARFRATPEEAPFLIHLGEGTDAESAREIFELDRLGGLDSRTVIIHGVGLNEAGRALVEARGAALVWCPSSNLFTLGKTLGREELRQHRRVALGSDSALTGAGDLLDEVRLAMKAICIGSGELYRMVTDGAAEVLRLRAGVGALQVGGVGDLIAVPDAGQSPADTLAESSFREVELAVVAGKPHILSESLLSHFSKETWTWFERLAIGGLVRWVRAPVAQLLDEVETHLRAPVRLAGRLVRPA